MAKMVFLLMVTLCISLAASLDCKHGTLVGNHCQCATDYTGDSCDIHDIAAVSSTKYSGTVNTRDWDYYHIRVSGRGGLIISLNETSGGDADIYVKVGGFPTRSDFEARDITGNRNVVLQVNVSSSDPVFVGVYGFRKVSYDIRLTTGSQCPNDCSGHGRCSGRGECICDEGYSGVDCSEGYTPLPVNQQISGHVAADKWQYYAINVPVSSSGYAALRIDVTETGGAGMQAADVDAYLRYDETPTISEWDVRDISVASTFQLEAVEPRSGTWFLGMFGFRESSFTVKMTLVEAGGDVCPNACSHHGTCNNGVCRCDACFRGDQCEQSTCNLAPAQAVTGELEHGSWNYFPMNVQTMNPLTLTLTQGMSNEEDCDLYVRKDERPTRIEYDYHDAGLAAVTTLEVPEPDGEYWVGIYAFKHCSYSLELAFGSANTCPNNCNNHGQCEEGQCVCNPGFAGNDCSNTLTALQNGATGAVPTAGSVQADSWQFYSVVSSGELTVIMLDEDEPDSNGRVWLYASAQITPNLLEWDLRDRSEGTFHQVIIERSQDEVAERRDETWIIGVYGSPNAGPGRPVPFRVSQFQPRSASKRRLNIVPPRNEGGDEDDSLEALKTAIDELVAGVGDLADAFKSTSSQAVESIVELGFQNSFQQSTLFKAFGVPKLAVDAFSSATTQAMGIPADALSFFKKVDWSTALVWTQNSFTFVQNGRPTTVVVYKYANRLKGTVDFLYVKVSANVELSDDVLLVTDSTSTLGGYFSKQKVTVQRQPHELSVDDAERLQLFFQTVALGKLAEELNIPFTFPTLDLE